MEINYLSLTASACFLFPSRHEREMLAQGGQAVVREVLASAR